MAATTKSRTRETWSSSEIDHIWAHQKAPYGRCTGKRVFFRGAVIYSYGDHFPMARLLLKKGKPAAVLITTRTYSTTTAGHLSDVRSAVRHLPAFYVHDVTETDHRKNLKQFRERIAAAAVLVTKGKAATLSHLRELDRVILEADRYAEYFGLATRHGYPTGFDAAAHRTRGEAELRKQVERADARAAREREKLAELVTAYRAEYPARLAEYEAELAAWVAGEKSAFPRKPADPDDKRFDPRHRYDYGSADRVRLRVRGSRIETSRGVVFEVEAAKPLLLLVRRQAAGEVTYPDMEVGGYRGVRIDYQEKTVSVGCHTVAFAEVERIAQGLGL